MIADDMMSFIKSDIIVFGLGVLLFIIATLWFVFRKLIWIIVPISSCFFSVLIMTGFLGLLRLEGNCHFIKLYCSNVDLNYGNEYSYEHSFLQLRNDFPNLDNFEDYLNDNWQNVLANYLYCINNCMCFSIFNI